MTQQPGRVVLITGCSSGIGRALAEAFAECGHRVVATARRPESIESLASNRTLVLPLDVTDAESIESAVTAAMDWSGRLDILVNNAGYALVGPMAELDLDDFRRQLETNVVGVVALTRAVVPHMAAQGGGCIVNIGSVSSLLATPFGGAYSASKAALHLLTDALRPEVAPFGIKVVVVRAGGVATEFPTAAAEGLDRYRNSSSLYRRHVGAMEERAAMSKNLAMSPADLARSVVEKVTRENPPAVIKLGGGARIVPAMAMLPKKLLAWALGRKFGLRA
jgi:NAD(P)-dependent dehydrogenase (short-subunit alcohol dehydrogenase family)